MRIKAKVTQRRKERKSLEDWMFHCSIPMKAESFLMKQTSNLNETPR